MTSKRAGGDSPTHQTKEKPVSASKQLKQTQDCETEDLKAFIQKYMGELSGQMNKLDERLTKNQKEMKTVVGEVKELVEEKTEELQQSVTKVATVLTDALLVIEKKVEDLNLEVEANKKEVKEQMFKVGVQSQRFEEEITMLQFRNMEFALRLRGLRENNRENLRATCVEVLAKILKVEPEVVDNRIDKLYRANSRIAKQRNLPRDVVIYFTERKLRNDILQYSFQSTLLYGGNQIGVFKELPPKMLRDRKDFGFLVNELKRRQIPFRWDVPVGIVLRFEDVRYRINSVEKAEQFYNNVLKKVPSPRSSTLIPIEDISVEQVFQQGLLKEGQEAPREEIIGAVGGVSEDSLIDITEVKPKQSRATREVEPDLDLLMQEPKDQRITRAAGKQRLETCQEKTPQEEKAANGKKLYSEAVGGARPKTSAVAGTLRELLQELQPSSK